MVEISSPSSSANARSSRRPRPAEAPKQKKPIWLFGFYALFFMSCLNFYWTYQDQKELVRLRIEKEQEQARERVQAEILSSAGGEDHVVTAGVGSSQYGASMKATEFGKKKKNRLSTTLFDSILPRPSDGSNDYITTHSASEFEGFSFYVMADTPYTELEEQRLQSQMAELANYTQNNSHRNLQFGIHLGGTQKDSQCAESTYQRHADMIAKGPRPTFVTPGRSDWFDCPQQDEALGFFLKHLGPDLPSRWQADPIEGLMPLDIQRSTQHPELFSLCVEGILFIGLHMVDPPTGQENTVSRNERMQQSMEWLAQSIEGNFANRELRGVVLLGHAQESPANEHFFAYTRKFFAGTPRANLPVLYLHGDGQAWEVDKNFSPFYDVQVDPGGLAEPCIIDVAPQRKGTTKSLHKSKTGKETILGKGLFRLDQRQGRYPDAGEI